MSGRAPFIETFTGARFCPLDPDPAAIRIHDIAHALSNLCRFGGHVRHFYSVAEHSVRVARYVDSIGGSALRGLLHDAAEAYLVDLPSPLKETEEIGIPYELAEARLQAAICRRFRLAAPLVDSVVKSGDRKMLATEVRDLKFGRKEHWTSIEDIPPLVERIIPWAPEVAEAEFLKLFDELMGKR